jgi:hypothetical protein
MICSIESRAIADRGVRRKRESKRTFRKLNSGAARWSRESLADSVLRGDAAVSCGLERALDRREHAMLLAISRAVRATSRHKIAH